MKIINLAFMLSAVFCCQAIAQQTPAKPAPTTKSASAASDPDGTEVDIYPILGWLVNYGLDLGLPPYPAVPGSPGVPALPAINPGGKTESNFGGAYAGGFDIRKGAWIVTADGMWGQKNLTRTTAPNFSVDFTAVYFHAAAGHRIYKDFYFTGGVRYISSDIKVKVTGYPDFARSPGVWDPIIGLTWRRSLGEKWKIKANIDGGGFGVGSDSDIAASARADWRMTKHFGMAFGYGWVQTKVTNTVASRTLTIKQTLNGPILGIGLYF